MPIDYRQMADNAVRAFVLNDMEYCELVDTWAKYLECNGIVEQQDADELVDAVVHENIARIL